MTTAVKSSANASARGASEPADHGKAGSSTATGPEPARR